MLSRWQTTVRAAPRSTTVQPVSLSLLPRSMKESNRRTLEGAADLRAIFPLLAIYHVPHL